MGTNTQNDQSSGLDLSLDLSREAPLPEEASPFHPSLENRPFLYVQILDGALMPRGGLTYEARGAGLAAPRRGTTEEDGELLIEDCDAGVYELCADGVSAVVHTLSQSDLDQDGAAYRVVLDPAAEICAS